MQRVAARDPRVVSPTARRVMEVMGSSKIRYPARLPSFRGWPLYPALFRFWGVKASVSTMRMPPSSRSWMFVFSAAGFMATRTPGWSPGVRMSREEKLIW